MSPQADSAYPAFTHEVARLGAWLGPAATLALVEAYGGTRLYVPEKVDPETDLARVLGAEAHALLSSRWGRDVLKVPVARKWRILVYRGREMSYAAIARKVGCSENMVWRTLSDRGCTNSQLSLF